MGDVLAAAGAAADDDEPALWWLEEHILLWFDDNLPTVIDEEHDDEAEIWVALLLFDIDNMTSSRQPTLTIVLADDEGHETTDERFVHEPKGDSDEEDVQYSKL